MAAQYRADLSVRHEVERVAEEFLARNLPPHVLVNNAGAVFDQRRESADGIEMTLVLNHFAYFILSLRLLDALKAVGPAQIINTAIDLLHALLHV